MRALTRHSGFCLFAAVLLSGAMLSTTPARAATEYEVKAAFILNFVKFTRWPAGADTGDIHICVLGNVQNSPLWLHATPSISKGVASNFSATSSTSLDATNRNCARGSTKRRISQGQAMRSIFGRWRVTHTVRPSAFRFGIGAARLQPPKRRRRPPAFRFQSQHPAGSPLPPG